MKPQVRAALATLALVFAPATGWAQSAPARTAWGAPDLQGVWNHGTATPLERPERHAGRARLTEAEIAEVNAAQRSAEGVGARRVVWWERGLSDGRTSMIVDPPDGRMPLTPAAAAELGARPPRGAAGPEDRNLGERCISSGVPRLGGPYSQNIHIAQTPDHVEELLYEVTFEDPKLWTQPWTAALTMPPTDGPMFEYACHERNDGMTALLDIARGEEAAARGESGSR
ncbi:MAG: hypothetical protein OXH75_21855 [Acidobacteria bacterium]|nr:hypothetical protein [Acidobacteriota bacterium]